MARRKKKMSSEGGSYLQTFADMVTLLLVFFILLFTMSVIDVQRFERVMDAIHMSFLGQTGILEDTRELEEIEEIESEPDPDAVEAEVTPEEMEILEQMREGEEIMEDAREFLDEAGLDEDEVDLEMEERGVVMELPDRIFFEIGEADLRPGARDILDLLADLFEGLDNQVIIEGHTCDLPIQTERFPSNWELSVGRSVTVTRYLVEQRDLEPDRFIATGYGEYQPLVPNDTEENRARNRRVTVVISVF